MMNEFEAKNYVHDKGAQAKTLDDLFALAKEVFSDFNYDYGVAPRSVGELSARIADVMCCEMGMTGFQAGFVMWGFVRSFMYGNNKCGLKMVDYDKMLYPQYEYDFDKTISEDVWKNLQNEAKSNLESNDRFTAPNVKKHWESIVAGVVPFGYRISDE